MMRRFIWPILIVISAILAGLLASSSFQAPVRLLFTLWFLLVCPGMAFARLFKFKEKLAEWVLAIGISIAIDVILSEIAVLDQWWSLQRMVDILVALCFTGAMLQVWNSFHYRKQDANEFNHNG
jgi:uncharacterized membrane protein